MKKNSFTEMFYKNAGYFVVVLISLVYVASSLINISRSGKSVYEIVGTGVLSLILGVLINGIFRSMGVQKGDCDERTLATNQLHAKSIEEILPYIDRLDEFCEAENARALRAVRTRILAREGMKYSDYFDDEGNPINAKFKMQNAKNNPSVTQACHLPLTKEATPHPSPAATPSPTGEGVVGDDALDVPYYGIPPLTEKSKRKAYRRALRVRLKPLLSSNLTSDGVKATDPFDFGRSKKSYTTRRSASDVIIKLLMALIFGYFGVTLSEPNVASIIWNSLQIILYISSGIIQMYSSYSWVVDDYRASIIKKIDYLQKFKIYALSKNAL